MWIHLPITQSQYAVDTAVLTLGSERLSQLQQSAMWKSKFQQQQSWQRVWKRDTSIRRLSGLTLKPSILNRGVEKWISSLEGSLASPSQSQGRSSEKMTQETSGPTQPDLLGGLGFQSSFLKMCQESSDTTTTPYDPNFERWATRLRKDYSQRQRQAHPTSANDFSFWPTARASDNEGGIPSDVELLDGSFSRTNADGVRWGVKLKDATANWTTPLADDTNTRTNKFAQGGTPLSMQASNWPTPKAGNPGSRKPGTGGKVLNEEAKNWPTPNTRDTRRGCNQKQLATEVDRWPTPTVAEADKIGNRPNYGQHGLSNHPALVGYPEREKMEKSKGQDGNSTNPDKWPTPRVSSANGPSESEVKQGNPKRRLETEVSIWPTPAARDYKGFDPAGKKNPSKPPELYHSIHRGQEIEEDGHSCSPSCRRLNPLFAEHLMGLPLGWTCVSEPLAMELYRQWRQSLLSTWRRRLPPDLDFRIFS